MDNKNVRRVNDSISNALRFERVRGYMLGYQRAKEMLKDGVIPEVAPDLRYCDYANIRWGVNGDLVVDASSCLPTDKDHKTPLPREGSPYRALTFNGVRLGDEYGLCGRYTSDYGNIPATVDHPLILKFPRSSNTQIDSQYPSD